MEGLLMGRIRDELYDSMWDSVSCKKHNWVGPDRRFSCPSCVKERNAEMEESVKKAKDILKPYGLDHLVRGIYQGSTIYNYRKNKKE
jgi:transposase-like protein